MTVDKTGQFRKDSKFKTTDHPGRVSPSGKFVFVLRDRMPFGTTNLIERTPKATATDAKPDQSFKQLRWRGTHRLAFVESG